MVAKVASVEESVAKVEGKVDEMDKKLLAELAELKALLAGPKPELEPEPETEPEPEA